MGAKSPEQLLKDASAWWSTALIDIRPGEIGIGGYPIQDLIGKLSFPEMIWVMLRRELPTAERAKLLEAAMVAAVDHGPQAPSIAISRMAITCGLSINGAMASAINVLDDVHGGAGQQCMELYNAIARDRKSTRLNSSHTVISYAVFCLKKKKKNHIGIKPVHRVGEKVRKSSDNLARQFRPRLQ